MLPIPENVLYKFNEILQQRAVVVSLHVHYRKWLRYFLDFSRKYSPPEAKSEQVRLFTEKLKSKKQTPQQCTQAAHAVSLFFESQKIQNGYPSAASPPTFPAHQQHRAHSNRSTVLACVCEPSGALPAFTHLSKPHVSTGGKHYNEWRCLEKTKSPEWDQAIEKLAAEIKIRHYSRKTLKAYADWGRKFQRYLQDKPPDELSSIEVKEYLTSLAVKCRVAASTQNQAFNALLFLFRHVLKKDFGDQRDVPRAKQSRYIPLSFRGRKLTRF